MKLSFSIRWELFKLRFVNRLKLIFKGKLGLSRRTKKLLKYFLEKYHYYEFPKMLEDFHFYRVAENKEPTIKEIVHSIPLATETRKFVTISGESEVELSCFEGTSKGTKGLLFLSYNILEKKKKEVKDCWYKGLYIYYPHFKRG